ncbi:collagen alpha-1(I) chain-like [Vulpes lagopus]|uniref:collagen alpha-1(I) chain-like n=1 Tax=Vulpes lagopus TaxID=494514 RepID=UPI001BC9868B|nr:collagen alpha-1(I) chain-like [Vulpes lagopus]
MASSIRTALPKPPGRLSPRLPPDPCARDLRRGRASLGPPARSGLGTGLRAARPPTASALRGSAPARGRARAAAPGVPARPAAAKRPAPAAARGRTGAGPARGAAGQRVPPPPSGRPQAAEVTAPWGRGTSPKRRLRGMHRRRATEVTHPGNHRTPPRLVSPCPGPCAPRPKHRGTLTPSGWPFGFVFLSQVGRYRMRV